MTSLRPERILAHLNADSPSQCVIDAAIELAQASHGRIEIVDVIPAAPWPASLMDAQAEVAFEKVTHAKASGLLAIANRMKTRGVVVSTNVLTGPTSVALIKEVLREQYDLLIREPKGSNSQREGFFGTTSTQLLRNCPCPVLLVNPKEEWSNSLSSVTAAVDATTDDAVHAELNNRILEMTRSLCNDMREVDVVSAWSFHRLGFLDGYMPDSNIRELRDGSHAFCRQKLDELVRPFGLSIGWKNVHVLKGVPGEVIPRFLSERQVKLLVIGTVARSGFTGALIGNTAEQILNRVECSVLAIKPEGFVSTVKL